MSDSQPDTPERRNMLRGWCPQAITLSEAFEALGVVAYEQTQSEFADASADDIRAATYLQAFTTLQPFWRDRPPLQRAADIELRKPDGSSEIVEITSTLENDHERDRRRLERLAEEVQTLYAGPHAWVFHLAYGWAAPPTGRDQRNLARSIVRELDAFDAEGREHGRSTSAEWLFLRRDFNDPTPRVEVVSWSTNTPDSGDEPYLNRLSRYLSNSPLIQSKMEKLIRESEALSAERRHLYPLMASMGLDGALLPTSPSYLTWGDFRAPPELTDLWLDGGTREIYHWSIEAGWQFHRLWGDISNSGLFGDPEQGS